MIPTYCIVCDELPERQAACRAHLTERGVDATYWKGYHGRTWGLRTALEYDPGKHLPPGHVGLDCSVWALWQHIHLSTRDELGRYRSDDDPVVVFEDDVCLPELYQLKLNDLLIELRYEIPDWDLVFLGTGGAGPRVWYKVTERIGRPNSQLCRLDCPFGTHALLLRRRALPVLLDKMRRAERNLDQQLWKYVLQPGHLKWCAVLPSLVTQRTFDYTGMGKPEWGPSCVHPDDDKDVVVPPGDPPGNTPVLEATEQDAKRLCGVSVPDTSTPLVIAATERLTSPFPCVYKGEFLEEDAISPLGKVIPINQCARLNVPCHSRAGTNGQQYVTTESNRLVRPCETCELRLEMAPTTDREKLPLPEGHFNPSLLMYDGRLILATRDSWGHSKVSLWELHNDRTDWTREWTVEPIDSFGSDHPDATRLEDPRLFTMPDDGGELRLCAMLNLPQEVEVRPDGYHPKRVRVGYVRFVRDLSCIDKTEVYSSPNSNLYEKNWTPFWSDNGLNWVYATKPEHIVLGEWKTWRTPNPLPWTGGAVRGGACPVLMSALDNWGPLNPGHAGPAYYHFFHGALKRLIGTVYTVGCCVFEAVPPYRVIRQTTTPLVWPDLPGPNESVVKRYVVFPGGAVPHAGAWHISVGVDDTNCRIIRLPFDVVESALSDVPEQEHERVTSIRDTPVALGTRGE